MSNNVGTNAFVLTARFSSESYISLPLFLREGAGKAGRALDAPAAPCARVDEKAHGFDRYSRDIPAFPAQWSYGLYVLSPGKRPFLPPLPVGIIPPT